MASLVDAATEKFKAAVQARRDSYRETEEDLGVDRATAQAQYEERIAKEQAERVRLRYPSVSREAHEQAESKKWSEIWALRNLRTTIETERRALTAQLHVAVEAGDLELAIAAVTRQQALDPVANVAGQRLQAFGVEK